MAAMFHQGLPPLAQQLQRELEAMARAQAQEIAEVLLAPLRGLQPPRGHLPPEGGIIEAHAPGGNPRVVYAVLNGVVFGGGSGASAEGVRCRR